MKNKFDLKSMFKKIKDIDLETIVNFIGDNRKKIEGITYVILSILFFVGIVLYGTKAVSVYHNVEEKIKTIEIIKDSSIKNFVKNNKLRTLKTVASTLYILEGGKGDMKQLKKLENKILKYIVVYRFDINKDNLFSNSINSFFFGSSEFDDLDINKKIEVLRNIDNKEKLRQLLGSRKLASIVMLNAKKYSNSDDLKNFLNEFPNIGQKAGDEDYNKVAKVLKNLYLYEYLFIKDAVNEQSKFLKNMKIGYDSPYKYFLTNIYLPSINIWSDKYSSKIHVDVFGEDYLKKAKYIDINLMSYWGKFFQKTYNGELYGKHGNYNQIQNIDIGAFTPMDDKVAKLPIKIDFLLDNDKMFYALISKLTSTSDKKNILLINEFTYYLWKNISAKIKSILKQDDSNKKPVGYVYLKYLLTTCDEDFTSCDKLLNCKGTCDKSKILKIVSKSFGKNDKNKLDDTMSSLKQSLSKEIGNSFKKSTIYRYLNNEYYKINDINKLIGARLNNCIFEDGYCDDILSKDGKVVANAIEDFSSCNKGVILKCINGGYTDKDCNICRENFVRKFDTNYFIPYTLVSSLDRRKYTLVDRLKDVYKNIPDLLELDSFIFSQNDEGYNSKVSINVYYKYLSQDELQKILSYIGHNKCSPVTNNSDWNISFALNYINKKVNNLYKGDVDASGSYSLKEKKKIIEKLNKKYNGAKNVDKLLYALQVYRIFKESGYCDK